MLEFSLFKLVFIVSDFFVSVLDCLEARVMKHSLPIVDG